MLVLFMLAAVAYAAATLAYGSEPNGSSEQGLRRYARNLLLLSAVLHVALIGAQCVHGDHPLASVFLAANLGAWIAVAGYLVIAWKRPLDALGAMMAATGLIGLLSGVLLSHQGVERLPGTTALARAHVSLAVAGFAGFVLAAGVAGLYLLMERRLRQKSFRPGRNGMSLTGLDKLMHRLVLFVTPVFTLAIVTGVLWILRAGGPNMLVDRMFEIVMAAMAWFASLALVVARAAWGTRGRRSAWLTLTAFAAVLLVMAYYGVRA